jgi:hypothetical protein
LLQYTTPGNSELVLQSEPLLVYTSLRHREHLSMSPFGNHTYFNSIPINCIPSSTNFRPIQNMSLSWTKVSTGAPRSSHHVNSTPSGTVGCECHEMEASAHSHEPVSSVVNVTWRVREKGLSPSKRLCALLNASYTSSVLWQVAWKSRMCAIRGLRRSRISTRTCRLTCKRLSRPTKPESMIFTSFLGPLGRTRVFS